ncbi:MAG: polyphenol oxidase family protein [Thermodesulfobacteriota bacterium]
MATIPLFDSSFPELVAASHDRHGGVSSSPFDNLNISYGVGDIDSVVTENRNRIKAGHGFSTLCSGRQVHGDRILIIDQKPAADSEVDGFDAFITSQPGVGLMVQHADCQPVVLYDPVKNVAAGLHCGWRGSVINIIQKTVLKMAETYGCNPSDIHSSVGPSLGPCCAEFVNHPTELPPSFSAHSAKENYFNFWKISKSQMLGAGLLANHISLIQICTSCNSGFFSYRRACRDGNGITGRNGTVIGLKSLDPW